MVTTATTATTATAATAATAGGDPVIVTLGVVAVALLVVLLVSKELAGASENPRAQRFSQAVNVGTVPLLCSFVAITVSKVVAVLA